MSFWDRLVEEARSLGELTLEWAILIAVALLVLIVGRWILRMVRGVIQKIMGASWLDGIWERSGVNKALANTEQTAASITATVLYAYLMIGLFLIVVRILRLDTLEVLLQDLLVWVPQLILAAVIVIVAAAAAHWLKDLVQPLAAERGVGWVGGFVYIAVIVLGVVFALDIMEISFAEDVVKILITAFAVALAIAFGVGGIDTAKLWWSKYGTPNAVQGGGSSQSSGSGDSSSNY